MKKDLELIRQAGLLAAVDPREIEKYLADGSFRTSRYGKNSAVHFAGEGCSRLEIILSGKVVIERIGESGSLMTVAAFSAGDILGGNLMFSKSPYYPMTVTAREPAWILEISADRLFRLFSDNHAFLRGYLGYVADHTAILGDRITRYVNRTIRECLLGYLEQERRQQGSSVIRLGMTKKELAERMGVQRTSLCRELSKMRDDGLVRYSRGTIEIMDG